MNRKLLEKLTTVEINTVIVKEIVNDVFIPWEVYQSIYYLSRAYITQSNLDLSFGDRYLQLRRQLELAYCLLLIDPSSNLYQRKLVKEIERDLPTLSQPHRAWEEIPTRLPEPIPHRRQQDMSQLNQLLENRAFVEILSQLGQSKSTLDRRDRLLHDINTADSIIDTTYAQTLLKLDGKIVNRYTEALLERSDRQTLLQLHSESAQAGEQQWRGLLKFMLSLVNKS